MGSINLNKQFSDYNKSYLFPVEYNTFCKSAQDFKCLDTVNSIKLFNKKIYNNFTEMSKILAYKDNLGLVATLFEVETTNATEKLLLA